MTVGSGLYLSPAEKDPMKQNSVIRSLIEGRSNAVGTVTLSTSATSTTVTAPNCGPNSIVILMPTTANAAAAHGTTYVPSTSVTSRSFVISHASSANTDLTFFWAALG